MTKYTIQLADGRIVTGPVQGNGGLMQSAGRMRLAIERANKGSELRTMYEPEPGHVTLYTTYTAKEQVAEIIDLRGSILLAVT